MEILDSKPKIGRPSKAEKLKRIYAAARKQFDRIESATRDDRQMSRDDRRFASVPGAQWEGPLSQQFANKPRLELNRIMGARIRLEGEHRANRALVDFMPRDGSEADELANACDGLFRADWQDSHGDGAGDNAFTEQILGGVGAMRVRSICADEDDEDCDEQRIAFEPIVDADISVYWDLNSKDQQKRDAMHCFVVTAMERAAFEEEYPDDDPSSWPASTINDGVLFDWYTPDVVKVAEYYVVEIIKVKYCEVKPIIGEGYEMTCDELDAEKPDDWDEEEDGPFRTKREMLGLEGCTFSEPETKKTRQVHKYVMSGSAIIEDCGVINGKCIPIVPFYGVRDFIDNKERWQGLVRVAKDPQRIVNMAFSRLAEISAYSPISVPIFHPEEVLGHQLDWTNANVEPKAYLQRNALEGSDGAKVFGAPMQYTKPPEIPPATVGVLGLAQQELKDILGNSQEREKVVPNISGKAIELIQQAMDTLTFIYLDNYKKGVERVGEVWLSMAPDVYVEEGRKLKTIGPDMKTRGQVTIAEPGLDSDGVPIEGGKYNLSRAKYDVVVDVGPSTTTKRAATVSALTQMLGVLPQEDTETRHLVTLKILENLEGEGLDDIRAFSRAQLVKAGVVKPTEEEKAKLTEEAQAAQANKQPDPQALTLQAMAQKEAALAQKAQADTALSIANRAKIEAETQKIHAQTVETVADLDMRTRMGGQPPRGVGG
jgi:hypothetical protein